MYFLYQPNIYFADTLLYLICAGSNLCGLAKPHKIDPHKLDPHKLDPAQIKSPSSE